MLKLKGIQERPARDTKDSKKNNFTFISTTLWGVEAKYRPMYKVILGQAFVLIHANKDKDPFY